MFSNPTTTPTRQHPRATNGHDLNNNLTKKPMLFKKPDYYWSLDQQNPHLPVFLSCVEADIKAAAQEYQLDLHVEDLQRLQDNLGDCQLFSPPETIFVREKATRLSRANPSMQGRRSLLE
jgi:hypothetical protein